MRCGPWLLAIFVLLAFSNGDSRANEPKKKPDTETIPAPRQQIVTETVLPPDMPRPGTREMWRYYGVDSFGRFRPRVILMPYGSYYLHNLEPYPWPQSRTTRVMPYVVD